MMYLDAAGVWHLRQHMKLDSIHAHCKYALYAMKNAQSDSRTGKLVQNQY